MDRVIVDSNLRKSHSKSLRNGMIIFYDYFQLILLMIMKKLIQVEFTFTK